LPEEDPRPEGRPSRRRRLVYRGLIILGVLLIVVASGVAIAYKKLEGNINTLSIDSSLGTDRPAQMPVKGPDKPLNVLVMGSDSRAGTNIGGETPGLSDTTLLLHLSAKRDRAYGVSIPRDAMVQRPSCKSKNGKKTLPAALSQFNAAYAVGGPACTIRTVEALSKVRIDHFVVVNFAGFKDMVNAVNGVTVCVPQEVNDDVGHIHLPAGTYKVNGNQALDYVRVRHGLGLPNGDIGRMRRQQAFIAAMVAKVVSKGTLTNPVRLYRFLDAATSSLTTDPEFANLKQLVSVGTSLKDIGLDKVQFITVPNEVYPPDPNRLQIAPAAANLWRRIRMDEALGRYGADAVTPDAKADGKPSTSTAPKSTATATPGTPSPTPSTSQIEAKKKAAEDAGLCA